MRPNSLSLLSPLGRDHGLDDVARPRAHPEAHLVGVLPPQQPLGLEGLLHFHAGVVAHHALELPGLIYIYMYINMYSKRHVIYLFFCFSSRIFVFGDVMSVEGVGEQRAKLRKKGAKKNGPPLRRTPVYLYRSICRK